MASIEEAVAGMLTTRATVTALVATRVYDTVLPAFNTDETTYPAITFQVVSREDEPHFTGYCPETRATVQLDVWAATAAGRRALADVVRTAMKEWSGPWGGLTVRRAFKESDFDGMDGPDDGGPLPYFRNTQRWTVWTRQAPTG